MIKINKFLLFNFSIVLLVYFLSLVLSNYYIYKYIEYGLKVIATRTDAICSEFAENLWYIESSNSIKDIINSHTKKCSPVYWGELSKKLNDYLQRLRQ